MLSKEQFIKCMKAIEEKYITTEIFWEKLDTILSENLLDEIAQNDYTKLMIMILKEAMGDKISVLDYWFYECQCSLIEFSNRENVPMKTYEDMYDYIIENNE